MTSSSNESNVRTNIAPMSGRMPQRIAPMLPVPASEPFDSPDHIFELIWGGIRAQARVAEGAVRLLGRNGSDLLPAFEELARIPALRLPRSSAGRRARSSTRRSMCCGSTDGH